jgi:hypothetical protein
MVLIRQANKSVLTRVAYRYLVDKVLSVDIGVAATRTKLGMECFRGRFL